MLINYFSSHSERIRALTVLGGVVILFIVGFLPQTLPWIILSIVVFIAAISLIIIQNHLPEDNPPKQENKSDFSEIGNIPQDWIRIENDQDVEELFQNFLENSLQLVKRTLVSNTVILLFVNYSKKEFNVRHCVTGFPDLLLPHNSFDIYKGLPSLVLRNRLALIENHLPEGQEIIPYYRPNENPSRSFAAVPVYYKDLIIGVLCVDSEVEEAYSNDDLEILKHFGNLISVQLFGSNKLYEYEAENWLVNTLFEASQQMNQISSVDNLWNYLIKKIPEIISCDRLSISRKINETEGQIVIINGGVGNLKSDRLFSLSEGIVGWVMRKNQPLMVEDFSNKDNYVPRFHSQETPAKEYLSLLSLPIASNKNVVAAVCLESFKPKNFKEQHKRILQTICNHAATIYMTTQSIESLRLVSFKDSQLDIENVNAFEFVFPKEMHRAKFLNYPLTLIFIRVEFQVKEPESYVAQKALTEFLSLVLPSLSGSDYIFRLSPEVFVIMVSGNDGTANKQLAGTIIQKVSSKKIWADGLVFDFYIHIGIVGQPWLVEDCEKVLQLGEETMKQSKLQGFNKISNYAKSDDMLT
jgi:GAF domain-containing protein/GGDEF domain-containing protein